MGLSKILQEIQECHDGALGEMAWEAFPLANFNPN